MGRLKLGIFLLNLKLPLDVSLEICKKIGVQGIQVWNVDGPLSPSNISAESRQNFPNKVKSYGLEISALCGHMNFVTERGLSGRIKKFKRILELSVDWETSLVTTESGRINGDYPVETAWNVLVDAMKELTLFAEKVNSYVAIEPGGRCVINSAESALRLIEAVGSRHLKVNYDPANILTNGGDPVEGVKKLAKYIVHTHAKDVHVSDKGFEETIVGKGDIPWDEYLRALNEVGFEGFLILEREKTDTPVEDMYAGAEFLRNYSLIS